MDKLISIGCVGDLILDQPGPMKPYFVECEEDIKSFDVMIGHVETPHTDRPQFSCIDIQAPASKPEHLDIMKELEFDIATTAGNHSYDCGPNGVVDTLEKLHSLGITTCGTGKDIYEAKKPAFAERNGIKIGIIDYNCAGPQLGWATSCKPGTNPVSVLTVYKPAQDMPGSAVKTYTFLEPDAKIRVIEEVKALKEQCDIAIVIMHKGNGGKGPRLENYEFEITHDCIDAGADIVFAQHHHMLKAIEMYKGKPIYHGLGNFVTVTYAMTPGMNESPEMVAYMKQRIKEGRGAASYDPPYYPWGEETLATMIASVKIDKEGIKEVGYIPYKIDKKAIPRKLNSSNGGQEIFDYVEELTRGVDLDTHFEWSEDGSYVIVK